MMRISTRLVCLLTLAVLWPTCGRAQDEEEEVVVKIFRVSDLVLPAPNYPYEGTYLPQMSDKSPRRLLDGGMGMGGGMMGGGMGGGMFQVPDHLAQMGGAAQRGGMPAQMVAQQRAGTPGIDMDGLIEAITTIVEPASWDEVDGEGSISPIGGALAIRQTPSIHAKVKEFLEALKRETGTLRMLTIEARWIALDSAQLAQLHTSSGTDKSSSGGEVVDSKALAALPADAERYAGQITCFNGQTVHLVSGRLESIVGGLIPVVGGASGVGYQPVMQAPHLGVLLQVTPSALPADDGVLLDLHSSITRWEKSDKAAHIGTAPPSDVTIDVDRINVTAQQFATSLRMPLDQPVLVGGITFPGNDEGTQDATAKKADAGDKKSREGLYLVVKIRASQQQ